MYSSLKPNHRLHSFGRDRNDRTSQQSLCALWGCVHVCEEERMSLVSTRRCITSSAQAAAIHELFVNALGNSAGSYAATEAANVIAAG
jgi:PE family